VYARKRSRFGKNVPKKPNPPRRDISLLTGRKRDLLAFRSKNSDITRMLPDISVTVEGDGVYPAVVHPVMQIHAD
jgi:hypothetical protein